MLKNIDIKMKRDIEDIFRNSLGFYSYNFNFIFKFCGNKKCVNISNYNSKVIPVFCE